MKNVLVALLVAASLHVAAEKPAAQVFTPTYLAPVVSNDLGLYLSDGPGEFALEGIWRRYFGGYDLGFRAGVADVDDAALLIGAQLRNPLRVDGAPIEFAFTAGVQAIVSDDTRAGFDVGLTIGRTFVPGNFAVIPYIHPRVGLVEDLGDDGLEATVLADVGVDLVLQPNLVFRVGLGLANSTADWGLGLSWR